MSRPDRRESARRTNSDVQASTWLKPEQVEALLDAALDRWDGWLRTRNEAILSLLYDVGLRRAEVAALNVGWLDLDERTLWLPGEVQKGTAPDATLRLGAWGFDATRPLRRWLDERDEHVRDRDPDALFPTRRSGRISGRSVTRNVVKPAAVAAEVRPYVSGGGRGEPSDVTAHTLRHSVAYRVIVVEGGRLEDVQRRLRHGTRETTDRVYGHIRPR
jgi:integrase